METVISGKSVMVDFEAEALVPMSVKDVSQKFQMNEIEKILKEYLEIDDYELEKGDIMGTKIEMEGQLPLVYKEGNDLNISKTSAWAIVISPVEKNKDNIFSKYDYKVSLETTKYFSNLNEKLKGINMLLGVNKTQPLKVKLKNRSGKIVQLFAGPIQYEGKMVQYFQKDIGDEKVTFEMKGGIYEEVQPSFLMKIEK